MKDRKPTGKKLMVLPLILGMASLFVFALYYYNANHAPYRYIEIIFVGPVFSFIGVIVSIITRKSRKLYPMLWTSGLMVCLFGFIICIMIIILLIIVTKAAYNGAWI